MESLESVSNTCASEMSLLGKTHIEFLVQQTQLMVYSAKTPMSNCNYDTSHVQKP